MPTYCVALLGIWADPSQFEEEEDGQESSLLGRLLVLKGQRLACVWIGSFWERRRPRASRDELLAAARLLAGSLAPPPTGDGLPHHLSSGTTCCFSCMATTGTGQNGFKKVGGILATSTHKMSYIVYQTIPEPWEKLEKHLYWENAPPLKIPQNNILWNAAVRALRRALTWGTEDREANAYYLPRGRRVFLRALSDDFPRPQNAISNGAYAAGSVWDGNAITWGSIWLGASSAWTPTAAPTCRCDPAGHARSQSRESSGNWDLSPEPVPRGPSGQKHFLEEGKGALPKSGRERWALQTTDI